MTDLEKLESTFYQLGILFTKEEEEDGYYITIKEGKGYYDFYASFHFSLNGHFVDYGVWE